MSRFASLEWRAIVIACIISLVGSAVIGFVWGIFGFALFATAGDAGVDAVSEGAVGYVIGIVLFLIPVVAGAIYLARSVADDIRKHCLVFGVVSLTLTVALAFASGGFSVAWHEVVYYLAIIPAALLGQFIADHM